MSAIIRTLLFFVVLALSIFVRANTTNPQIADSIWNLAHSYENELKWKEAATKYLECSLYYKNTRQQYSYAHCLFKVGSCYYYNEQLDNAIEALENCYTVVEGLPSSEREKIDHVLNIALCNVYSELQYISESQYEQGYHHFNRFLLENQNSFMMSDDELSSLFEFLDICVQSCSFCSTYHSWVDCIHFANIGLNALTKAAKSGIFDEDTESSWSVYFGSFMLNDMICSYYLGCYDKLKLYQRLYMDYNLSVLLTNKSQLPTYVTDEDVVKIMLNSANYYHYFNELGLERDLLANISQLVSKNPEAYTSNVIEILTYYNNRLKLIEDSDNSIIAKLNPKAELLGEKIESINIIARHFINVNDYKMAYRYIESCPDTVLQKVRGSALEQDYYINKCLCEIKLGNISKGIQTIEFYNNLLTAQIKYNASRLISVNREQYLESVNQWFSEALPLFTSLCNYPELLKSCYNATLLYKNALLESNANIVKIAHNSPDPSILYLLNEYKTKLNIFSSSINAIDYNTTTSNDLNSSLLLSWFEVNSTEQRALDIVNSYGSSISDFMDITWDKISRKLESSELAIEFIHVTDQNGTPTYYALVNKKNNNAPEFIKLCQEDELAHLDINSSVNHVYNLIWKPILEKDGNGVSTIYFSADQILHIIPIEYCTLPNGQLFSSKYNCFRLSSTRKLLEKNHSPKNTIKSAYIFGNIDFNASFDEIKQNTYQFSFNNSQKLIDIKDVTSIESDYQGGSIVYYPWNNFSEDQKELQAICKILKKRSIDVTLFEKSIASEDLIKTLSFKDVNLLHISTHGLYVKKSDTQLFPYMDFVQNSTNPMYRSVLICAGVNNLVKYGRHDTDQCDGLLLAHDIANLNLNDVDLVVLSTCDSGLGDITSDGVWGMQRGFKQAGCNTILMSLSPVNEVATRYFMEAFYSNYIKSSSKIEAIKSAQEAMINSKEFSDPQYWASFILIDAI